MTSNFFQRVITISIFVFAGTAYSETPASHSLPSERYTAPVTSPDLKKGQDILYHSFEDARPIWLVSSLPKLIGLWVSQATDPSEKARLSRIQPFSEDYYRELRLRYGLLPPHFENDGLPLGLTKTDSNAKLGRVIFPGTIRPPVLPRRGEIGMNLNCLFCHARAIPTASGWEVSEGIGNPTIDFQRFHNDMSAVAGSNPGIMMERNPKRNSFVNGGDALGEVAALVRHNDDSFDQITLAKAMGSTHLTPELQKFSEYLKTVPLIKTPAWAALGAKRDAGVKGYYADASWNGGFSHVLAGIMISKDKNGNDYKRYREAFDTHGWPYLQSQKSPKYPWKDSLAIESVKRGAAIFDSKCSMCHGTYTAIDASKNEYKREDYPGILVPLNVVGTDPRRALYSDELIKRRNALGINHSVMSEKERGGTGYIAPPLDGIWARGPYFHNGSAPTLSQVLNSKSRFKVYASDLSKNDPIDGDSYDRENGGWKVEDYSAKSVEAIKSELKVNPYLRVYDPRLPEVKDAGLTNTGHTFGDGLSEDERRDLIQFLMTL